MPIFISGINNVTDKKQAYKEIKSILLITILVLLIYFNFKYITGEAYIFFLLTSLLMTIHIFRSVLSFDGNIVIILRYLLIAIPIYVTSLLWFLYRGDVKTHYLGLAYQTLESTTVLVTAGFLSILGCALGWHWGCFRFSNLIISKQVSHPSSMVNTYLNSKKKSLAIVGCFGCLMVGVLYFYISGGLIGAGRAYAQGGTAGSSLFATSNVFQMFFAALVLIASSKLTGDFKIYVMTVTMLGFLLGILAGSRADYLFPMLIIAYVFLLDFRKSRSEIRSEFHDRSFKKRRSLKSKVLFSSLVFGLIIGAYFLASGIAIWRQGSGNNVFDIILDQISNYQDFLFPEIYGEKVFWMETGNHVIGALYSMITHHKLGSYPFFPGETYLLVIPRLLPSFIRPNEWDRSMDLAWHTNVGNVGFTQGGIFEAAEAYANFGILGCFFISALVSYFLVWLLKQSFKRHSIFYMAWYITCGFLMLRGVWYQNFAFVRAASVMAILYILLYFLRPSWIKINTNSNFLYSTTENQT
jgi:hypothetical protein